MSNERIIPVVQFSKRASVKFKFVMPNGTNSECDDNWTFDDCLRVLRKDNTASFIITEPANSGLDLQDALVGPISPASALMNNETPP